eukprot:1995004-Alexandrium_andersonii.AAC.1
MAGLTPRQACAHEEEGAAGEAVDVDHPTNNIPHQLPYKYMQIATLTTCARVRKERLQARRNVDGSTCIVEKQHARNEAPCESRHMAHRDRARKYMHKCKVRVLTDT